jgi:hypothetical protein
MEREGKGGKEAGKGNGIRRIPKHDHGIAVCSPETHAFRGE